jgi:hypothetical protein
MKSRTFLAASTLLLALAAPAFAGLHYTAETTTSPEGQKAQVIRVEGWVDGEKAKVVFQESDQPMLSEGAFLLTQDGGKTVLLVDPEEETITEWDLQAMLGMVGGIVQGMQGIMNLEFSDVKVEELEQGSGGELLGYPVTHAKYRTTYTTSIKVLGMKRASTTETVQEVWTTDAFGDPALGIWLRSEPPTTGIEDLDALIAAEMEKAEGFPLKTVAVSTTTGQKGKRESTTRSETVVTVLEEVAVPEPTFELPAGYERISMTGE